MLEGCVLCKDSAILPTGSADKRQNYLAIISLIFAFTILPFAAGSFGTEGTLLAMLGLNCLVTIPLLYLEYSIYLKSNAPT